MDWILGSSAARDLYKENILRVLALPVGAEIQYRYGRDIVSPTFLEKLKQGGVSGDTVLLCYLDSEGSSRNDPFEKLTSVPIRLGEIVSANRRGTSIIVVIRIGSFLNWAESADPRATVVKFASDPLPSEPGGKWLATAKKEGASAISSDLAPASRSNHLLAFERTCRQVLNGKDFRDDDIVVPTALGVWSVDDKAFLAEADLKAGRAYEYVVYHYAPDREPSTAFKPLMMEFGIDSEDSGLTTPGLHRIEAEYDEVRFGFRLKSEVEAKRLTLRMSLYRNKEDGRQNVTELNQTYNVKPLHWPKLIRASVVMGSIWGGQALTLARLEKLDLITGSVAFLLAGFVAAATIYKFKA